jgi:hypothetical protein
MAHVPGPIARYLAADHQRLHALLEQAASNGERFDQDAFEEFRRGLLRHIGIEEKILLPEARRRLGRPLAASPILRREHGALAALMVPTPDHALVEEVTQLLVTHNAREEGPDAVYAEVEALVGNDARELLDRIRQAPAVPTAAHNDGRRAVRTAAAALALADRPPPSRRSLVPREHGAYAQLALPMVVAVASGRPGLASASFVIAGVAAFLAHEPLCVLAGVRGKRARVDAGKRAGWMLALATPIFAAAAVAGAALSPAGALAGVAPACLAVVVSVLAVRRRARSGLAEVLAAAALSGAALPVAVAAGTNGAAAASSWLAWIAGLGAATLAVRSTIERARGHSRRYSAVGAALLASLLAAVGLVSRRREMLGALPLLTVAAALLLRPPRPTRLRAVGWILAAATLLSGVALLWANHTGGR